MALTNFCDVFGSFHEDGFNNILNHIRLQRPSLFNYATQDLAFKPGQLCEKIKFHPEVKRVNNPLVTVTPYLPIPGYNGPEGMSYSVQLTDLKLDLHPGNIINLPSELDPPLKEQSFAMMGKVCGGIGCPEEEVITSLIPPPGKDHDSKEERVPQSPTKGIPFKKLHCFCLELYLTGKLIRNGDYIEPRLTGLELVDIRPEGLENSLECYISTLIRLSLLPRLRIELSQFVFELTDFISIGSTPISADVPFNPSIEKDKVSVFLTII